MKKPTAKASRNFFQSILAILIFVSFAQAAPVIRTASGANPAAIQATVDQFRADLGGVLNPNNGQSFPTGRREINWDGVPDAFASPNNLPVDFFNVNSPRGVVFDNTDIHFLHVSANAASGTAVRFGDIDPSYTNTFQTFSPERLFAVVDTASTSDAQRIDIVFFIPGTKIPATASGFGVVFTDVDISGSLILCYGTDGKRLGAVVAPAANGGLSFVGVSFNAGERIARVKINAGGGGYVLAPGNPDTPSRDMVAMDDFIYGEPRAATFHSGDADGDGVADARVFRPSNGTWFTINSGSSTASIEQFGVAGDIPIDGDFDGDSRADVAVFRPSEGGWYVHRSSNGTFITQAFGQNGDKPVAADYDKDGKTDIAIWRPTTGTYFVLRSSDNLASFFAFPFGQNGDIPVQGGAQ